jgi:hypothetical protein
MDLILKEKPMANNFYIIKVNKNAEKLFRRFKFLPLLVLFLFSSAAVAELEDTFDLTKVDLYITHIAQYEREHPDAGITDLDAAALDAFEQYRNRPIEEAEDLNQLLARYSPTGKLNAAEWGLLRAHPYNGLKAIYAGITTTGLTTKFWTRATWWMGNGDAFRHATWNWSICKEVDCSWAKTWTDAHESESNGIDKEMDLFNNSKGREYFQAGKRAGFMIEATGEGYLRRIVNNRLVPTDYTGYLPP